MWRLIVKPQQFLHYFPMSLLSEWLNWIVKIATNLIYISPSASISTWTQFPTTNKHFTIRSLTQSKSKLFYFTVFLSLEHRYICIYSLVVVVAPLSWSSWMGGHCWAPFSQGLCSIGFVGVNRDGMKWKPAGESWLMLGSWNKRDSLDLPYNKNTSSIRLEHLWVCGYM